MKKIYFQPACVIAELGTCKMMAESLTINTGGGEGSTIENPDDILTKEDKNVWDEEW